MHAVCNQSCFSYIEFTTPAAGLVNPYVHGCPCIHASDCCITDILKELIHGFLEQYIHLTVQKRVLKAC